MRREPNPQHPTNDDGGDPVEDMSDWAIQQEHSEWVRRMEEQEELDRNLYGS